MTISFQAGDLDSPDVQALVSYHFEDMHSASPADACHVLELQALRNPSLVFFSMRENGVLVAVGALNSLAPDHAEIKSMRSAPSSLRSGNGRAMLRHLIAEARKRGFRRVSLETGTSAHFAPAQRLYESEGFHQTGPFAQYKDTQFTRFLTRDI